MTKLIIFSILLIQTICSESESKLIKFIDSKGILHDLTESNQIEPNSSWTAWAQYENRMNKTGWAQLEINTNGLIADELQAYSSGLIEGYLTSDLIQYNWDNNIRHLCDNYTDYCNRLFAFIQKNIEFTKSQIEKFGKTDPYWHQIKLSLIQLTGIEDGYESVRNGFRPLGPRIDLKPNGLLFLNLQPDTLELDFFLNKSMDHSQIEDHCSAIVKVLDDGSDLFVSHNTWITFAFMVRIVKRYNFNYKDISAKSISFSSYPGIILSFDDFYLMSSGLSAMETTLFNFNRTLWKHIDPDQIVLGFLRISVANRLASSGKEWTQIFSKYNSGTYNTHWMITDMNKFERGVHPSNLSNDLLWVLEQMPGYIEAADKTEILRTQHYWSSYNIPYFQSIYDLSGTGIFAKKYGDFFTYDGTPRARIFKRDHKKVTNSSTLYKLMRYNDFKNDPLSRCEECNPPYSSKYAIAARCDLDDPKGHYPNPILGFKSQASIDTKLSNSEMFKNLEMIANNGPTYDNQPPFQWSTTRLVGVRHFGQPDLFKFPPVHIKWSPADQMPINL